MRSSLLSAVLLLLPGSSSAVTVSPHVLLDLGWNRHEAAAVNGGVFGAGVAMKSGPILGAFALDATLQQAESAGQSRYYMDTFSNGQSRCRDRETGQFVSTSQCNAAIDAVPGITAEGALIPFARFPLYFGGGVYVASDTNTPYLSVGYFGDVGEGRVLGMFRVIMANELFQARMGIAIPLGSQEPDARRWGQSRATY